ncbi:MAG: methylmalonyl Co-A mutase-associated GTPase MeaB [Dongiaceae bacterium]
MTAAAKDRIGPLARSVIAGDRRALAQAITLIESTRADHRDDAAHLVDLLVAKAGGSFRLGISGPPGVGKSTFIERFGLHLIEEGHRVAVLAVDPSSRISGGSILGDKTRMPDLSRNDAAFIRPSPAGDTLGGVARRTREALIACEAAGFDIVIVETVGVGQSETAVAGLTDAFLLLLQPGSGDELQGIKRGVMELADLLVVNKTDGTLREAALLAAAEYRAALGLLRPTKEGWTPEVLSCSALNGTGIEEVRAALERYRAILVGNGTIARLRAEQNRHWLKTELTEGLIERLRTDPRVAKAIARLEKEVAAGRRTPLAAAEEILAALSLPDRPKPG